MYENEEFPSSIQLFDAAGDNTNERFDYSNPEEIFLIVACRRMRDCLKSHTVAKFGPLVNLTYNLCLSVSILGIAVLGIAELKNICCLFSSIVQLRS